MHSSKGVFQNFWECLYFTSYFCIVGIVLQQRLVIIEDIETRRSCLRCTSSHRCIVEFSGACRFPVFLVLSLKDFARASLAYIIFATCCELWRVGIYLYTAITAVRYKRCHDKATTEGLNPLLQMSLGWVVSLKVCQQPKSAGEIHPQLIATMFPQLNNSSVIARRETLVCLRNSAYLLHRIPRRNTVMGHRRNVLRQLCLSKCHAVSPWPRQHAGANL